MATDVDSDNVNLKIENDLTSGLIPGVHYITWIVTDNHGHQNTNTQTLTIVDTTAPIVTPPNDIMLEATGATTAVSLGSATATDMVDGIVTPVNPDMSGPFTIGTHTITWTATDNAANTGSAIQTITIVDNIAPIVTPPVDIVLESTGATTVVNLGTATAVDIVDGVITPTADMSSPFAVSSHTVTWSATDTAGNTGIATQAVNVQAVISGITNGLNDTVILQNNGSDNLIINATGGFRFTTALNNLSNYAVTVLTQPTTQTCTIANANGQVNGSNVSDLVVDCTDNILSSDSNSLDYGTIFVGDISAKTVTLTNTGNNDVVLSSFTYPNTPFTISSGNCLIIPVILLAGQSCDFVIQFSPISDGNFTGSFNVISNATSSPITISVVGASAIRIIPTLSFYGLFFMIVCLLFVTIHKSRDRKII